MNERSSHFPLLVLTVLVVLGLGIEAAFHGGPRVWTKLPVLGLVAWALLRRFFPGHAPEPEEG